MNYRAIVCICIFNTLYWIGKCQNCPNITKGKGNTSILLLTEFNMDCSWNVTTPKKHSVIELRFIQLKLTPCSECSSCPHLDIYEGPDKYPSATLVKNRLITRICGNQLPGMVVSAGNALNLKFNSSNTTGKDAFNITFTFKTLKDFNCPNKQLIGSHEQGIRSPLYGLGPFEPKLNCSHIIQPQRGYKYVRIDFLSLYLGLDKDEKCQLHSIKIFDNKTKLIDKCCSGQCESFNRSIFVEGPATVYFITNYNKPKTPSLKNKDYGFLLRYTNAENILTSKACDPRDGVNVVEVDESFQIISPNITKEFKRNFKCVWNLKSKRNSDSAELTVKKLHVGAHQLTVIDSKSKHQLNNIQKRLALKGSSITIEYLSDFNKQKDSQFFLEVKFSDAQMQIWKIALITTACIIVVALGSGFLIYRQRYRKRQNYHIINSEEEEERESVKYD